MVITQRYQYKASRISMKSVILICVITIIYDSVSILRSSLFKRQVVRVYNNTCCISGMRVDALNNASMIDACHIIPFSLSHDDTIGNGIALCPTLHRAFDRGLVSVDENYRVMVSKAFAESPSRYALRQFQGQQLLVPALAHCQPLSQNFAWHREMVFEQMGEMLF